MRTDWLAGVMGIALVWSLGCGKSAPPESPRDQAPVAPTPEWTVTPDGIGSIRVGWTVAQLNAALHDSIRPVYDINDECTYLSPAVLPAGTSLMVVQDTIVRVDVDTAGIRTAEGVGVGDTEARVKAQYPGRVATEPHKYTGPEGHYLIVSHPGDTVRRIVFETDGRVVERYRAGRRPAVDHVEGCS